MTYNLHPWGSKDWANEQLRYAIKILDDRIHGYKCLLKGRIVDGISFKNQLLEAGFPHQARILSYHINRARARLKRDRIAIVGFRRIKR